MPDLNRRQFLATTPPALFLAASTNASDAAGADTKASAETSPIIESPALPQPHIEFATDGVPRDGEPRRIAAITTAYFKYSHADDIITKFMEGYAVVGRIHQPHCKVVSLYVEQMPDTDIGRGMAARYKIPLFKTARETLTLGGDKLAVDGVLLIGEHGDYPINAKGQKLYPRGRLFQEIVNVFRSSGRSVPVYNDKHFSYDWDEARAMYDTSHELKFPMMAGSSVPVGWRHPPLELRRGAKLESALAVAPVEVEILGFHALECLQAFAERRQGGETGIRAVQCLSGKEVWKAAERGDWDRALLDAAIAPVPNKIGKLEDVDAEPTLFLVDYADGLRGVCYISPKHVPEFAFSMRAAGQAKPAGTWCNLPKPQRDHFSFLCNHIEKMFLTGQPSYPVERTLLATGALAFLMDSRHEGGKRLETPALNTIRYPAG